MDVSTRKLRYFVAVAEELHFSRAAARLFVAQQALSKQTRELEDAIGVQLLRRTTRSVELTPAGEVFLQAAREALAVIDGGIEGARRTARGESGTLKVGFLVGAALELTAPIFDEFALHNPGIELDLREFGFEDVSCGLNGGWADLAFVRTPVVAPEAEFELLFVEPRVAAVSRNHRLAGHPRVSVQELVKEKLAVGRSDDTAWQGFWVLDDHRDGTSDRRVLLTGTQTEEAEMIAAGVAVAVTASGATRYLPHPAIRYIPIDGAAGSELSMGWRRGRRTPLVERFLAAARTVRDREVEIRGRIEQPAANNEPANNESV